MFGRASAANKKVLVARFDRAPLQGFIQTPGGLQADGLELLTPEGTLVTVPYSETKAVCFIRDFETAGLKKKEDFLQTMVAETVRTYPKASYEFHVSEQYRNMKDVLDVHPQVVNYAKEAIERAGLTVKTESLRGGTDGSRLSFMGLPCPNLFTGMQAIHSRHEWIGVKDMERAVMTLVYLVQLWQEKTLIV